MAVSITVSSMPGATGQGVKVARKLVRGRERQLIRNALGVLDRIARRDGKVSLAYDETDFRSQGVFVDTGISGLPGAVTKVRNRLEELLSTSV